MKIDTPLTRLQAKYEDLLAEKDRDLADYKAQTATVRGVNDMLKLELIGLEKRLSDMQKTFNEVVEHVRTLKLNLPDLDRDQ